MQPTLADRNNNPGNIRDTKTGKFRQFATPQEGFGALMNDLEAKKTGRTSTGLHGESNLAEFASKYAPANDNNNVAQYTANIANHLGVRPDTKLKDLDTGAWAEAIAKAEGYSAAKQYQPRQPKPVESQIPKIEQPIQPQPQEQGGAPFKYNPNDNPLVAGLKTAGNLPSSGLEFAKGAIQSLNPVSTINNIAESGSEFSKLKEQEGGVMGAIKATAKEIIPETYKTLVPEGVRNLLSGLIKGGNLQDATKQFVENPVGNVAPVVLATQGFAKGADNIASKSAMKNYVQNIGENFTKPIPRPTTKYSDAFDKGVQTTAGLVTKPLGGVIGKVSDIAKSATTYGISKFTGMNPETIHQILKNPEEFTKAAREETSRGGLANEVKNAIDTRLSDLSETGKGYESIKKSGQVINADPYALLSDLQKYGFEIKKGQITSTTKSITRNKSDINALNRFYKDWGGKTKLTTQEFLNMRSDLAGLAKYDKVTNMGKTAASEVVANDLRNSINNRIGGQIPGLRELDAQFAPERQFLGQVKKDFIDNNGNLKDNAPSRIANSPNKAELTKRLENIMPGITKKIEILKAVEDIERSSGVKVGSYGATLPGVIGFALNGVTGLIVSQIIATPENAVRIIRNAGKLDKSVIKQVVQALKALSGNINTTGGMIAQKSPITTGLIGNDTKVNN